MKRLQRIDGTSRRPQHGVSLLSVMLMVLVTSLVVMWASRTALFNEMVTGNTSDYQRAVEAAHAMLRDAEFDIRGIQPDGSACAGAACRHQGVYDAAARSAFYPTNESDYQDLRSASGGSGPSCIAGICTPDNVQPYFWTDAAKLAAMKKVAATYGSHTGAKASPFGDTPADGSEPRAWYWVEVLPYDTSVAFDGGIRAALSPDEDTPFVYRITAVAQGMKAATLAVVQTTLVVKRVDS